MPAIDQTLPGMYLPRLEIVQIRAASTMRSRSRHPLQHGAPAPDQHAVHRPGDDQRRDDVLPVDVPLDRLVLRPCCQFARTCRTRKHEDRPRRPRPARSRQLVLRMQRSLVPGETAVGHEVGRQLARHWAPSRAARRRARRDRAAARAWLRRSRSASARRHGPAPRPARCRRARRHRRTCTTGTPCISASAAASPNPSRWAGIRQQAAVARMHRTSRRAELPRRNVRRRSIPAPAPAARAPHASGPSPTIVSRTIRSAFAAAIARASMARWTRFWRRQPPDDHDVARSVAPRRSAGATGIGWMASVATAMPVAAHDRAARGRDTVVTTRARRNDRTGEPAPRTGPDRAAAHRCHDRSAPAARRAGAAKPARNPPVRVHQALRRLRCELFVGTGAQRRCAGD